MSVRKRTWTTLGGGVALAILLAVTVPAASAKIAVGAGAQSCGKWTRDHEAKDYVADLEDSWILGYVSASNTAPNGKDFLVKVDASALLALVGDYCREKPLDLINDAAQALVIGLWRRAR
jgi:hypothetical protein